MAKKHKKPIPVRTYTRTLKVLILIGIGVTILNVHLPTRSVALTGSHSSVPESNTNNTATSQLPPKAQSTQPVATSAPAPTAAPAPVTKPAVVVPAVVTTSSKPEPVVTPAPTSNVSGLAPVTPAPASSPSGSPAPSTPTTPTTTTAYTSLNWSGYMATTGSFTAVGGSWIAPSPTSTSGTTTADSTWIGIGGVSASDLIQIGTQNTISPSGKVATSAFYEMLPAVSQTVPGVTVTPGDSLTASITQVSSGQWSMTITDITSSQSYTNTVSYASSLSSAEWIEEDPSYSFRRQIPFDNFQTATFTNGTTTLNGATATIAGSTAEPVTMTNRSGQVLATPSVLTSGGDGFTVTRTTPN